MLDSLKNNQNDSKEGLAAVFGFMYWIGMLREFHDHLLSTMSKIAGGVGP